MGASLGERLALRQAVKVAKSALVQVPTVIGYLRPMVLLPAVPLTGLSIQEIEFLLAHELAHIRRHDYLHNLVQGVIETLLFYHPAMWWVSSCVRRERENCCDDLVVATLEHRTEILAHAICVGAAPFDMVAEPGRNGWPIAASNSSINWQTGRHQPRQTLGQRSGRFHCASAAKRAVRGCGIELCGATRSSGGR